MKDVIGYIRVSTVKQDEDRQHKILRDYCKSKNYTILEVIEEKQSGTISDRQGIQQLLNLGNPEEKVIFISNTSRLTREEDYMGLLDKVRLFMNLGFDVFFIEGEKLFKGGTTLTLTEIITLAVEAKSNSDDRLRIISNTQTGKRSKILKGAFVGGKVPLGYKSVYNTDISKGKKRLEIDEDIREIIETIFDCVANKGMTKVQTAEYVNISVGTIGSILHNELYTGKYKYTDSVVEIPAIISKELFDKVQSTLQNNILM